MAYLFNKKSLKIDWGMNTSSDFALALFVKKLFKRATQYERNIYQLIQINSILL